jgi:hypothetical protein
MGHAMIVIGGGLNNVSSTRPNIEPEDEESGDRSQETGVRKEI